MKTKTEAKIFMEGLFLHPKPVKMLTFLRGDDIKYATQVSKAVDCTYSHTVKVLEMFRRMGLASFEKKGRVKIIKLTADGHELAHDFEGVRRKFHRISGNIKESLVTEKQKPAKAK